MSSKTGLEPAIRPRTSLATRLTVWYAGSAFLLVLAVAIFLYAVLVANLEREDNQLLDDEFQSIRALLLANPSDLTDLRQRLQWEGLSRQHFQFMVRVQDSAGRVLIESLKMNEVLPAQVVAERIGKKESTEFDTPSGQSFHVVMRQVPLGDAASSLTVQVAMDRTFEEELLASYRRGLAIVLALALLLCAMIGYQIARRGLRPLREMAATARRIRSTTLHERIEAAGLPTELSFLAGTFNEMLDRLKEAFDRLSRFSADIAHELRTPVNNLRGEAEVALGKNRSTDEYRDVLGSCLEECGRLSRMIDSLLFLARAEKTTVPITAERLDVGKELESVREFYDAAASEAGITLSVLSDRSVYARVDRTLLQRAVGNLVSNAIAHTPSGGEIRLTAAAQNGKAQIEVRDTGPGIPSEHLPHIFDRFYRADAARSSTSGGVGLGLAIVRSIAAMHGGSAEIESTVGHGTRVILTFPSGAEGPQRPLASAS